MTCAGNFALGAWSLYNESAGTNNTAVGTCAGHAQKGATTNTFVGSHAGVAASTGSGNVFIGYRAGCACTTQSNRLYIGNATPILVGDITCGLVGIGTTSVVTHAADTSVLQIGGNAVLWGNKTVGASKSLQISQNAYYDEDTTWQYVSTDEASNYYQDSGTHAFRYAASGSAGADITWSTALAISNAGKVGIGTTAAAQLLHLQGAASAPELLIEDTGNNTATITLDGDRTTVDTETGKIFFAWNNNDIAKVAGLAGPDTTNKDDGQLTFQTAAPGGTMTEAMRIDESQNVGIGTAAPATLLDVTGTGNTVKIGKAGTAALWAATHNTCNTLNIGVEDTDGGDIAVGSTGGAGIISSADSGKFLQFATAGTVRTTIDNAGKVGIGTTAPTDALVVAFSAASMTCGLVVYNKATDGNGPAIRFESDYDSSRKIHSAINGNADGSGGALSFHTSADNSALTRHMIIKPDGKVGIGTPNPNSTLELCTSNCTTCFTMVSNGNADVPGIKFCSGAAVQPLYSICGCWGSGSVFQDAHCGMAHVFQTCAVQRLLITSNGCMAVGNTVPQGLFHIFAATAGTHTPNTLADQLVIEDNTNAGMTIVVPDAAYAQIIMGSPGADGSYCSNARLAGGYNSGNQRFDISVGGCDSAMTVYDTGCVNIGGVLSKGSGSFRIQHPLESRDGYDLVHSFTESPQADLLYSGWTKLTSGITTINIDTIHDMTEGTFVALNRCIRVFTSNESDWDMVRGSVTGNQLTIESNNSSSVACVSWLVIGERCDKHMFDTGWTDDNGRVIVEPETAPPLVIEE